MAVRVAHNVNILKNTEFYTLTQLKWRRKQLVDSTLCKLYPDKPNMREIEVSNNYF